MSRVDISPYLVHFTSGASFEEAFQRLGCILEEGRLLGSSVRIRGGFKCVCFSEAPLVGLSNGLVNESYYSRYSPFGVLVSKQWLFEKGGRPVIYETEEEYSNLSESHAWRHMRYDVRVGRDQVDFLWEREWRVRCDYLEFDSSVAQVVVLNHDWAERLKTQHEREEAYRFMQYSTIFDEQIAQAYYQPFQWRVLELR